MAEQERGQDDGAAMAAMGLPVNFAAPTEPRETQRGSRPHPGPPGHRGGRGRDEGWQGRLNGRGRGTGIVRGSRGGFQQPPASMRGHSSGSYQSRGGHGKRKRERPLHNAVADKELIPLQDLPPLYRPSFEEQDPWAQLS